MSATDAIEPDQAHKVPINLVTGNEGKVVQTLDSMDEENKKRLEWFKPTPWWEMHWWAAFNDPKNTITSGQLGSGSKVTNILKMKKAITVQFPECEFPFGVSKGKFVNEKPSLAMHLDGAIGEMVEDSYENGDFFKQFCNFIRAHAATIWPEKTVANASDDTIKDFLMTKNTCKLRKYEDKETHETKKVLNLKFYCIGNQLKTKIFKLEEGQSKPITVPINEINLKSRGIVTARINQFPYKDTMAATMEIMEVVITKEGVDKIEGDYDENFVKVTPEELNDVCFTDFSAVQKKAEALAAAAVGAATTAVATAAIDAAKTKKTGKVTKKATAVSSSSKSTVPNDGF